MASPDALSPGALSPGASCSHTPACPASDANDCRAARIVSDHLQDCGYALLCNGLILLAGEDVLPVPTQRQKAPVARSA